MREKTFNGVFFNNSNNVGVKSDGRTVSAIQFEIPIATASVGLIRETVYSHLVRNSYTSATTNPACHRKKLEMIDRLPKLLTPLGPLTPLTLAIHCDLQRLKLVSRTSFFLDNTDQAAHVRTLGTETAAGQSTNPSTAIATLEVISKVAVGVTDPKLILIYCSKVHDPAVAHAVIAKNIASTPVLMVSNDRSDPWMSAFSISDKGSIGVGVAETDSDPFNAALAASFEACHSAGKDPGKLSSDQPGAVVVFNTMQQHDDVIDGVRQCFGEASLTGAAEDLRDNWIVSQSGVYHRAVAVVAMWTLCEAMIVSQTGFVATDYEGTVTGVSRDGLTITTINSLPAVEVYNRWTGNAAKRDLLSLNPLGKVRPDSHQVILPFRITRVTESGGLETMTPFEEGDFVKPMVGSADKIRNRLLSIMNPVTERMHTVHGAMVFISNGLHPVVCDVIPHFKNQFRKAGGGVSVQFPRGIYAKFDHSPMNFIGQTVIDPIRTTDPDDIDTLTGLGLSSTGCISRNESSQSLQLMVGENDLSSDSAEFQLISPRSASPYPSIGSPRESVAMNFRSPGERSGIIRSTSLGGTASTMPSPMVTHRSQLSGSLNRPTIIAPLQEVGQPVEPLTLLDEDGIERDPADGMGLDEAQYNDLSFTVLAFGDSRELLPTNDVTILFTNIQSSCSLWQHSPRAMMEAMEAHNHVLRSTLARCRSQWPGTIVKIEADRFMIAFVSPLYAACFSAVAQIALMTADWPHIDHGDYSMVKSSKPRHCPVCFKHGAPLGKHCRKAPTHDCPLHKRRNVPVFRGLRVKMGFHTGRPEPMYDLASNKVDYIGIDVNLAARICSAAEGGQILMSKRSAELIQDEDFTAIGGAQLESRGVYGLKGIGEETLVELRVPWLARDFDGSAGQC
ncbi:Adenylate and Guanylate cyclase catalytic domain [Carpediemonas membranifera]|uniref:Adenylate and Guanylate cyclase catalytic domain n=1 Tax=Carpediemonas membranifera TaxID=201153 RepID=A0A8J6E164_9EUKA|nr:Adenylate and Guanylate cyclase catalytic domain [Carpediemonas membranifera]|eukprot:KAG9390232.1 Adenylate and Guanylate cyclase catalytic domain [Carpediemonas membranifera]